jgi:hypothetical protein
MLVGLSVLVAVDVGLHRDFRAHECEIIITGNWLRGKNK